MRTAKWRVLCIYVLFAHAVSDASANAFADSRADIGANAITYTKPMCGRLAWM